MSAANASAKKRRANVSNEQPSVPQVQTQNTSSSRNGLTLPQVIALVDSRITKLEDVVAKQHTSEKDSGKGDNVSEEALKPILQEYDHRFTILVKQISELQETVMKLQTYTMDVNKTLLEERIHFMNESTTEFLQESTIDDAEPVRIEDLKVEEPEIVSSEEQPKVPSVEEKIEPESESTDL